MELFVVLASLVATCGMAAVIPEANENKLALATNDLAFDLLRSSSKDKNVFISPFSISTALALVYLGADGTTAQAMRHVLKYDKYGLSEQDVHGSFRTLLNRLKSNVEDYQLSTYNSALVQKNFNILEKYEKDLREYYTAQIDSVDFATQGEDVKARINADVERETKGKIKNFLESPPSQDTKLFLLNAVYFLGNWKNPFRPESTFDRTFYNNGVQEKKVPMMSRDGSYKYTSSKELEASVVVLPYKGENSASMIVVLPNEKTGAVRLQQVITQQNLNKALDSARTGRIILSLPKFSLSYSTELSEQLVRLGLEELFGNAANLSRIAGKDASLKVSSVVHKAVIDVNEKGTEAAGATGIEIVPVSLPPIISVDHPFLFFIREESTGTILFSGRVDEL